MRRAHLVAAGVALAAGSSFGVPACTGSDPAAVPGNGTSLADPPDACVGCVPPEVDASLEDSATRDAPAGSAEGGSADAPADSGADATVDAPPDAISDAGAPPDAD